MSEWIRQVPRAGRTGLALLALAGLGACDGLLEVDLPASITESALDDPSTASVQVYSAIAFFECSWSELSYEALGHEDVWERMTGVAAPAAYEEQPSTGRCDASDNGSNWYAGIHIARSMAAELYEKLGGEWSSVPDADQLRAISAIYAGASLDVLGEHFCEMAVDAGELLSPEQTLTLAESAIGNALAVIEATGDFAISDDISPSARAMAYGLRARIRWAKGDAAGAVADAEQVPMGFTAWVTRDDGRERRNKVYASGLEIAYAGMHVDVNDWWTPVDRTNPVTGVPWPDPIPFTGYANLGVLPDGRAVTDEGLPIRTHADAGSVPDPRVPTVTQQPVGGINPQPSPAKYRTSDADIPLVSWREMWLIRAELAGGQTAIDLVNDLRDAANLPRVTYADPNDPEEIRYMVLEEKRRELFAEGGRWWATKIQNTDLLWFPRFQGVFPVQGWPMYGGVRMIMPNSEYEQNPNTTLADRATMCSPAERPVNF